MTADKRSTSSVGWRKGRFNPGFSWRFLAHKRNPDGSYGGQVALDSDDFKEPVEFDELVIDHWFHIEQMSDRHWWMVIAGLRLEVTIDGDGRPHLFTEQESTPDELAEYCERWRTGQ